MKTALSLALIGAFAVTAAAAESEADKTAERLARNRTIQDEAAPSLAIVSYYLKLGPDGETPDMTDSRMLDRGFPAQKVGFVTGPDRVIVTDMLIRTNWIERIEVAFGGKTYPAAECVRYFGEGAVELRTDAPIAGARPLVFAPKFPVGDDLVFLQAHPSYGLVESFVSKADSVGFRRIAGIGCECVERPGNAIVLNASNEVASLNFRPRVRLADRAVRPPAEWKGCPAEELSRMTAETEARFAAGVMRVSVRLESKKDAGASRSRSFFYSSSGREQTGDERDALGYVLPGGEVFVPLMLTSEETARLRDIELTDCREARHRLEFVGAFGEWGAFVARFADGKLPEGMVPCTFHPGGVADYLDADGWKMSVANAAGKMRIRAVRVRFDRGGLTHIRGDEYVPSAGWSEYGQSSKSVILDDAGRVVSMQLKRRDNTERYSSGDEVFGGAALAALVGSHDFNPEFMPRGDDESVRVAWIGVDAQQLTEEVAREKKATAFLKEAGGSGVLVGKVYPGTPAAEAGIREGDVLVSIRPAQSRMAKAIEEEGSFGGSFSMFLLGGGGDDYRTMDGTRGPMPWPNVEQGVNALFTRFGIGKEVVVSYVSDGVRKEAQFKLAQLPEHFLSAPRSRNRDIGMTVCDLTFEVRSFYRLEDDAPGVVVLKLKPGDPAAVAGLGAYELITEVDGEPVRGAKDFGRKIKGKRRLTFSVRRLTTTRIVRIDLGAAAAK